METAKTCPRRISHKVPTTRICLDDCVADTSGQCQDLFATTSMPMLEKCGGECVPYPSCGADVVSFGSVDIPSPTTSSTEEAGPIDECDDIRSTSYGHEDDRAPVFQFADNPLSTAGSNANLTRQLTVRHTFIHTDGDFSSPANFSRLGRANSEPRAWGAGIAAQDRRWPSRTPRSQADGCFIRAMSFLSETGDADYSGAPAFSDYPETPTCVLVRKQSGA